MKSSKTCYRIKKFEAYLVYSHETPEKYAHFLMKRDNIIGVWKVSLLRVDDILEEFRETLVKWVQIHTAMDHSHQTEMLIDRQVLKQAKIILLLRKIHKVVLHSV